MSRYICGLALGMILLWAILSSVTRASAQSEVSFMSEAIRLAQQTQRDMSVPASVTLAQAEWETGRGESPIGEANNFFGIKAAALSDGSVNIGPIAEGWVWALTQEWNGTRYVPLRDRFRKYKSMADSFRDHALLLATTPRYSEAMRAVDDPREFARRLAAAGYATSPTYGEDLIRVMDLDNLYQYDLPRNSAEFLGQSDYPTASPGDIFQIYFDVKNTGFGTWSPTAGYRLASANDVRFAASATQSLNELVLPGRVKRWTITMFAPLKPGVYRTAWHMQHGSAVFGPELYMDLTVREPAGWNFWQYAVPAMGATGLLAAGGLFVLRQRRRSGVGAQFIRRREL